MNNYLSVFKSKPGTEELEPKPKKDQTLNLDLQILMTLFQFRVGKKQYLISQKIKM